MEVLRRSEVRQRDGRLVRRAERVKHTEDGAQRERVRGVDSHFEAAVYYGSRLHQHSNASIRRA